MNNNDFNFKRMDKGIAGGEHKIIFKTPDGKIYEDCEITVESDERYHTCVVNLTSNDKIEPKFKAGDVVTNISGLYPNVKCTITTVDKEKQCYYFKEVAGTTDFKDQDKLMLANIKPKFKAGDKVKGASSENPEKVFVINMVNTDNKCYNYFNSDGIVTMFKDQDKLTLVNDEDNVRHPVGDEDKSLMYLSVKESKAIAANAYASEIGRDTMTSIISKIKSAAAAGRLELKIVFIDYPVLNNYKNKDYLETWAKICGYKTSIYRDCMYIKWY